MRATQRRETAPRDPARTLADLYRRCGEGGGCPYDPAMLVRVLAGLREGEAREVARVATAVSVTLELSVSTVYGCLLELEDHGLARVRYRAREPVLGAGAPLGQVSGEITAAGRRLLEALRHAEGRRP